jgi:hypothetical protein
MRIYMRFISRRNQAESLDISDRTKVPNAKFEKHKITRNIIYNDIFAQKVQIVYFSLIVCKFIVNLCNFNEKHLENNA